MVNTEVVRDYQKAAGNGGWVDDDDLCSEVV
jgi:hypothetical protein